MVDTLAHYAPWKAKPARRVYIPKSNNKLRPLGIPVVMDRCLQAMVKNALEPAWEARFEGISYGFRPGRSCHDAIEKIYLLARPNKTKKWVLDADIQGAFDHISHDYLQEAIGPVPGRELIKQWLKAGYIDQEVFHETEQGTPQGGVISPLLANIALHGMEEALGVTHNTQGRINGKRAVVRYADDFVCFCETQEDAEQVQQVLTTWLAQRGLTLSTEKTRIVHLSKGFDFLGFNIRHYQTPQTTQTGWKLLIKREQRISAQATQDAQRPLEAGSRDQCPGSLSEAQPGHSRMGQLLPYWGGKRTLWQAGSLDDLQSASVYQTNAPKEIYQMAAAAVLGTIQSGPT
jgi:RNA-directed DNA polymerase